MARRRGDSSPLCLPRYSAAKPPDACPRSRRAQTPREVPAGLGVRVSELKVREVLRDLYRGVPRHSLPLASLRQPRPRQRLETPQGLVGDDASRRSDRPRRSVAGPHVHDAVRHAARIVRHLRLRAALVPRGGCSRAHRRLRTPSRGSGTEFPSSDVPKTQRARLVRAPVLHARHVTRVTAVHHQGLSKSETTAYLRSSSWCSSSRPPLVENLEWERRWTKYSPCLF